jgi:hypothetical protein
MFLILNLTVFTGAFLLFTIELIVANALLPGFGGSYLVWSSCMLFFQGMLLVGYLYANVYQNKLKLNRFFLLHFLLVLTPVFFPIQLRFFQNPLYHHSMIIEIMQILIGTIGLSFGMLASTSVMLQQVLGASPALKEKNPYLLYATSNLGSVIALLAYPFVITPAMTLQSQIQFWQIGYALFVLLHLILLVRSSALTSKEKLENIGTKPEGKILFRWLLLAASASALLLSVTNIITLDIAAIPLFWIGPLVIYLASFILTFKHKTWYPEWLRDRFNMVIIIGFFLYLLMIQSYRLPAAVLFILYPLILFIVCITCHGELNLSKPAAVKHLPLFYIIMSLGAFLGSLLVSLIIPQISTSLVEYPIALILAVIARKSLLKKTSRSALVTLLVLILVLASWPFILEKAGIENSNLLAVGFGLLLAVGMFSLRERKPVFTSTLVLILIFTLFIDRIIIGQSLIHKHRNFYGIYKIFDSDGKRILQHGTTLHGAQYLSPERSQEALTYYHIKAPAGELLTALQPRFRESALVGLGPGTLLTYFDSWQLIDIFELDPYNEIVSKKYFSFLDQSRAQKRIMTGDARINLRKIRNRKYDVLILDAFNSDAIPVHLLTREAILEYLEVMHENGLILLHISNKYIDLEPVLSANAESLGLIALKKLYARNVHPDAEACEWAVFTKSAELAYRIRELGWEDLRTSHIKPVKPWTDQYTNILAVLR